MGKSHRHGVESTAAILHHPIHPMLIPFPIATLVGVLVTELAFWGTSNPFWAQASFWLLAAGIVTGLVAAVPGLVDYVAIGQVRRLPSAHVHAAGNVTAVVLAAINLSLRWNDVAAGAGGWGLLLSILTVALLGITGWLGGELSYRHRIGVIADHSESATDLAAEATRAEPARGARL
jgi:uncharacterized membrane protein